MIIGIGHSPAMYRLEIPPLDNLYIYPRFFDNKADLIRKKYIKYLQKLWMLRDNIRIALYPDYVYKLLNVPPGISYIIPVHSINKEVEELYHKLQNSRIDAWLGFASNEKYRNYDIEEFLEFSERLNAKTWYLGVSTKKELKEVIRFQFHGFDITTMLLGKFEQIKNKEYVRRKIIEIVKLTENREKQLTILSFQRVQ
jgi:hypothetical protein